MAAAGRTRDLGAHHPVAAILGGRHRIIGDGGVAVGPVRLLDAIVASPGVAGVERFLDEDPPRAVIAFDDEAHTLEDIAARLADALNAFGDPLYERELEIVYR